MRALFAAAAFLLASESATACGYCVEDKLAAAYDHAVVMRALDRRHEIAFFAIEGTAAASPALQRMIEAALESTAGIDRGTSRVSLAGASLSFAYDPAHPGLGPVIRSLEKKLAAKGLSLSVLRVISDWPGTSSPVARRAP